MLFNILLGSSILFAFQSAALGVPKFRRGLPSSRQTITFNDLPNFHEVTTATSALVPNNYTSLDWTGLKYTSVNGSKLGPPYIAFISTVLAQGANRTSAKASITPSKVNGTLALQEFYFNCAVDSKAVSVPGGACNLQVTGFQGGKNVTVQNFKYDLGLGSSNGSYTKASVSFASMNLDKIQFDLMEPSSTIRSRSPTAKTTWTLGIDNMIVFV